MKRRALPMRGGWPACRPTSVLARAPEQSSSESRSTDRAAAHGRFAPIPIRTHTKVRRPLVTRLSLNDAMFLMGETRDHPANVMPLQLWRPPTDAGEDFAQ